MAEPRDWHDRLRAPYQTSGSIMVACHEWGQGDTTYCIHLRWPSCIDVRERDTKRENREREREMHMRPLPNFCLLLLTLLALRRHITITTTINANTVAVTTPMAIATNGIVAAPIHCQQHTGRAAKTKMSKGKNVCAVFKFVHRTERWRMDRKRSKMQSSPYPAAPLRYR